MDNVEKLMANYSDVKYKFELNMPIGQKGLYINNVAYLNPQQTFEELIDTVGEEIGHHLTTVGDIIDQDTTEKRQQEQRARDVGRTLVISPQDIIDCYHERFAYPWECAEFLGVSVEAIIEAIKVYAKKYSGFMDYQNYTILFRTNGTIGVYEWLVNI